MAPVPAISQGSGLPAEAPRRPAPTAIVPAAGFSRRMGRPKLLLPFGATSVVGALVGALRAGGVGRVVLVTAPAAAELAAWARAAGLVVAVNGAPERGMLSSIRCGLEALGGGGAVAAAGAPLLVSPADLPALAAETVRRVIAAVAAGAALAVPVHAGRRGHPLGIAAALTPEIEGLDPEVGLRQLVERRAGELVEVAVDDPGAVRDVDTPEDYRCLRKQAQEERSALPNGEMDP
ncbi:MAG TPA: nucleotidyltransferase family protein [Thermoanaerobaculia bacterium]|nr:nucleotidyltransferase family protein [Thermoanaerobaculia bacterium]